ncbi:aminotransferase class V-fold PLP-dependent enzyme [Streptomyces sp. SAS_276]|uniref:aminotransferase class V-fold PLP-dependent enzyme n=1 Tax=Streptomyces sp. SAS_276 TaxID=3412745 RepID=UPI00403C38CC
MIPSPAACRRGDPFRSQHWSDALFLSPHKIVGGPQTPGILVVRREPVHNPVPTAAGGGTVSFVGPFGHRYLDDPVAREEGGTPAIVESLRAGPVFALAGYHTRVPELGGTLTPRCPTGTSLEWPAPLFVGTGYPRVVPGSRVGPPSSVTVRPVEVTSTAVAFRPKG